MQVHKSPRRNTSAKLNVVPLLPAHCLHTNINVPVREPAQRARAHECPDRRDHQRRREGERPALHGSNDRTVAPRKISRAFLQIGLVPNAEWLKGVVTLSKFGEVVVDEKGNTNVPDVLAAGDATTVPYKQTIIAAGDGAKAALSAFDCLIRMPSAEAA